MGHRSGELERKIVALTAAVSHPERGLLGLRALRGTLGAVGARVAFDAPLVRGATLETELARVLDALVEEVRRPVEPG